MAVYICVCGHPKSQHKRERDGCRALDCGCAKFEADMAASAAAQGVKLAGQPSATVVAAAKTAAEQLPTVGQWPGEPRKLGDPSTAEWRAAAGLPPLTEDTLSTSARLAKAEQELSALRYDFGKLEGAHTLACKSRERNKQRADLAEAELASARKEISGLQAQLKQAVAYVTSAAEEKVRAVLAAADRERDELIAEAIDADEADDAVLHAYNAWSCLTEGGCGSRYTRETATHNHPCGPLTAVRVTITHRTEGTPA